MNRGQLIITQNEDGILETEIILEPQLTEEQRTGQEDLNDVQIIFGIVAATLEGVLRFHDEEEATELPEGPLL